MSKKKPCPICGKLKASVKTHMLAKHPDAPVATVAGKPAGKPWQTRARPNPADYPLCSEIPGARHLMDAPRLTHMQGERGARCQVVLPYGDGRWWRCSRSVPLGEQRCSAHGGRSAREARLARMGPRAILVTPIDPMSSVDPRSDDFLRSFEWRRLRQDVLLERGARCECCGASPKDGHTVLNVDHVKPRKYYPELALDKTNLQVLCGVCNHGKGNRDTDWRAPVSQATAVVFVPTDDAEQLVRH